MVAADMTVRYAIYWAPPPTSPLARFAAAWLGRDPEGGSPDARPAIDGLTESELSELTSEPARYGFHGTLKPPFRLADGRTKAELCAAVASFAAARAPFSAPPLALKAIGSFIALVPNAPSPDLDRLAADCVADLDGFRAPAGQEEIARRRRAKLTDRQDALLLRWGYPYVMEEFRFHLTLTGRLPPELRESVPAALTPLVAPFTDAPLRVEDLTLFVQPDADAPFVVARRFPLLGLPAAMGDAA
ncbi:MAG: DUF1045 domain-containing protein [Alphaproteobacteria bacterium]